MDEMGSRGLAKKNMSGNVASRTFLDRTFLLAPVLQANIFFSLALSLPPYSRSFADKCSIQSS